MTTAMRRLIDCLDGLPKSAGLDALFQVVRNHEINPEDVCSHVHFDSKRYYREVIVRTDQYEVLVLAWLAGQKSPITTTAGRSAACASCTVKRLKLYSGCEGPNGLFTTTTSSFRSGTVFCGADDDIHMVENVPRAKQGLVTLHIYRPALTAMQLYDVVNGRLAARTPFPA